MPAAISWARLSAPSGIGCRSSDCIRSGCAATKPAQSGTCVPGRDAANCSTTRFFPSLLTPLTVKPWIADDDAPISNRRCDLVEISLQDLWICRVVVGSGIEDDHRLRRVIALLEQVKDLIAVVLALRIDLQRNSRQVAAQVWGRQNLQGSSRRPARRLGLLVGPCPGAAPRMPPRNPGPGLPNIRRTAPVNTVTTMATNLCDNRQNPRVPGHGRVSLSEDRLREESCKRP